MAAFLIDRVVGGLHKDPTLLYGFGFQTRSPRCDLRSPTALSAANASGTGAGAYQARRDLISAYYSARNISTGYVDPPALPTDGSFDAAYSTSITPTVLNEHVAEIVDSRSLAGICRVLYPYNTATVEYGTPRVLQRPEVFWADTDLYPTPQQGWVSGPAHPALRPQPLAVGYRHVFGNRRQRLRP
jgi:hypothetical protein